MHGQSVKLRFELRNISASLLVMVGQLVQLLCDCGIHIGRGRSCCGLCSAAATQEAQETASTSRWCCSLITRSDKTTRINKALSVLLSAHLVQLPVKAVKLTHDLRKNIWVSGRCKGCVRIIVRVVVLLTGSDSVLATIIAAVSRLRSFFG